MSSADLPLFMRKRAEYDTAETMCKALTAADDLRRVQQTQQTGEPESDIKSVEVDNNILN